MAVVSHFAPLPIFHTASMDGDSITTSVLKYIEADLASIGIVIRRRKKQKRLIMTGMGNRMPVT
jgi:hypothetical protein